jgi:hypothetical protein
VRNNIHIDYLLYQMKAGKIRVGSKQMRERGRERETDREGQINRERDGAWERIRRSVG